MNLNIQNLSKTYPNGVKSLNDVSLELSTGMFGLLGPNGAGKSSLMRTIATLQLPDQGRIQFNDIDILKDPFSLRKQLGYLPQSFGVYPNQSAVKLLDYFATLKGIASKKDRNKIIDQVLHLTNLYGDRKKSVSSYSGGMRQRFGIAQMLLNNPKLIIVDEPTAGLDPAERNRFLNILREIGTNNIVIFSTHLVEDVKELCTNMAIINKGQIIKKATPSSSIKEIDGKVWTIKTDQSQVSVLENKHTILSKSYNEDNSLTLRVFSALKPTGDFEYAKPNLEDVYFISLNNNVNA